jgi:hypothetical protein
MFAFIGGTCDKCHDSVTPKLSFYGVTNLTTRPNGHHVGQDCSSGGCHNPNNWNGGSARKKTATAPAATRSTIGLVVNSGVAPRSATTALASGLAGQAQAAQQGLATPALAPAGRGVGLGHGPIMASLSHAGVTTNCVSCHNGVLAPGKGARHIASNNACENCHTTLGWLPARFDHQGVSASCMSCHNGAIAPGKPARHIQTTQDCSGCHGTLSWQGATFSHIGVDAVCQSCHNGITATAKQVQHVSTTLDCGSCHNTLNWTVTTPARKLQPLIQSPRKRGTPAGPNK